MPKGLISNESAWGRGGRTGLLANLGSQSTAPKANFSEEPSVLALRNTGSQWHCHLAWEKPASLQARRLESIISVCVLAILTLGQSSPRVFSV